MIKTLPIHIRHTVQFSHTLLDSKRHTFVANRENYPEGSFTGEIIGRVHKNETKQVYLVLIILLKIFIIVYQSRRLIVFIHHHHHRPKRRYHRMVCVTYSNTKANNRRCATQGHWPLQQRYFWLSLRHPVSCLSSQSPFSLPEYVFLVYPETNNSFVYFTRTDAGGQDEESIESYKIFF